MKCRGNRSRLKQLTLHLFLLIDITEKDGKFKEIEKMFFLHLSVLILETSYIVLFVIALCHRPLSASLEQQQQQQI